VKLDAAKLPAPLVTWAPSRDVKSVTGPRPVPREITNKHKRKARLTALAYMDLTAAKNHRD